MTDRATTYDELKDAISDAYPSLSPTTPITRPEKIRAVEGGLKIPLAHGRMLLTAAAFLRPGRCLPP